MNKVIEIEDLVKLLESLNPNPDPTLDLDKYNYNSGIEKNEIGIDVSSGICGSDGIKKDNLRISSFMKSVNSIQYSS
ncbi:hypothetical protein L2E82_08667 [Cichorium intybus]|uniref:Uncharacterized protein n=1 Tax=Cichorium intybus TaxID=13427 RepID=A0ACB9G6U0_CICIN|nr:hypothetical protein L2E82_08667 [Cichorium intybus]